MREKVFCIIKELILANGKMQSVILLDSQSEILEYDDIESADNMAEIFNNNSDSGYNYYVREI
jgi:hypothetical protein